MLRSRLAALLAALTLAATAGAVAAPPAQAAMPDAYGFVLWNGSATDPFGTWPAGTSVAASASGIYTIKFPGLAARGGVVHVTAVNGGARWCQAVKWTPSGTDQIVYVRCFQAGGAPAPGTGFTAVFTSSSGPPGPVKGSYGYVDTEPTGHLNSEYNSAGAANGVNPLGTGVWEVKLPGLSAPGPVDGGIQVTATDAKPARCKVIKWASDPGGQYILVACFDATGAPYDTRWSLSYQLFQSLGGAGWPPDNFGYLWNEPPLGPASTNFNSQAGSGANTIVSAGAGLSLVRFPKIGVTPDTVQVTASGGGSEFCNLLTTWGHAGGETVVRDVACYTNGGTRLDTGFLISANSAL